MIDNYIIPIFYGIVQGITEFLPISSSGHLVLLHNFLPLNIGDDVSFDVLLHLATLLAAIYYFRRDIIAIIAAVIGKGDREMKKIGWFIIMATIPAAFLGFLFEDVIENALRSILVVILMLVVVGLVFIYVERNNNAKIEKYQNLNWWQSALIGFSQALALIPGTSRSGITIIAGLYLGLKRAEAIKFSFLLSIPIILGANLTKIPSLLSGGNSDFFIPLSVGFISSLLAGYFSIKYLITFSKTRKLTVFAYYRFLLALAVLFYWILS